MATLAKPLGAAISRTNSVRIRSNAELARRRFRKNTLAMFGLITVLSLFTIVMVGPLIYTVSPIKTDMLKTTLRPLGQYLFGTDDVGRDMLARVLFGGRISLAVGLAAMLISISLGTIIGAFAGFFGGTLDFALMRITDLFQSLPVVPLLLLVTYLFRDSVRKAFGADLGIFIIIVTVIGALNWMTNARLVRSSFLSLKNLEFVEASRALGQNKLPIMFKHILPNSVGPIIVAATLNIGQAILTESTVSFLGLGFPPDVPTWGSLAALGKDWIGIASHIILIPAFFIFLTTLSVNFAGDGLRDALDPRSRR